MQLTFYKHVDCLFLRDVVMKPAKHLVGIDGFINVLYQILEDQTLLACSMCRNPQPAFSHIVVDEENISLVKSNMKMQYQLDLVL